MEDMQQPVYWPTSDSSLAAFLITQGYRIGFIDYSQPRANLAFIMAAGIQDKANDYEAGLGRIEPKNYRDIVKKLARVTQKGIQYDEDK